MILLAFFLPLAFYVLVLGIINRRPHPLLVSGPWDFAGVLFAASGFLIFGGPFVISTLNDNWRMFFLMGPTGSGKSGGDWLWTLWLSLSLLYFVVVFGGALLLLYLQRKQTVIYNIDRETFDLAFNEVGARLGLRAAHSGNSYLLEAAKSSLPAAETRTTVPPPIVLEVDHFQAMRHLTLRWSCGATTLRKEIEGALARQLNETLVTPSDVGGWFTVLAFLLLALSFLIGFGLLAYRFLNRV